MYLPLLQLEVFRPSWLAPDDVAGCVVLQQNRVTAMSALAREAGVRPGMRRGGVLMLLPQVASYQRDPAREQAALQAVAIALLQYSPQVSLAEDASILVDVSASLRLFGGIRALRQRIRHVMAMLGFSVSIGCAPTAKSAGLLARQAAIQGRPGLQVLALRRLQQRLDGLPLSLLSSAAPWLELLQGLGCHRLGQLRQLPRPGVQRRCGGALLTELAHAYGEQNEMHGWVVAPPAFKAKLELPDHIAQAEAILTYARSLLLQLTGWLAARQLAVSQISLQLLHERGRQAMAPTTLTITLAEAAWHDTHLLCLLKEKLAQLKLDAAVIAIVLEARHTVPQQPHSDSLFPEPGGSVQDRQRLLELLVARLGQENVLQAAPQADHRAEVANAWVSVLQKKPPQSPPAAAPLLRPSWLLPQALALEVRQHRPWYGSALKILSPAERIEAGWWSGSPQVRDYFVAESAGHVHYWIYRERQGDPESRAPVWYLHGIFG